MDAIWLKLTHEGGLPLRVNMNMVSAYMECVEKDKDKHCNASIEYSGAAYMVRETVAQIDDAVINPASKLRLKQGW